MSAYCPYTSTHKWVGVSYKKKFVFLTRVTRINNVQSIKDMLARIFSKTSSVDYQHYLIADLTVANTEEDFKKFIDDKTTVFVVKNKREDDKYCTEALDSVVQTIPANEDCWIYLLDDDNKIEENFAELGEQCNVEKPITVFNIKMPPINNGFDGTVKGPLKYKEALFHIDSANYIVHRSVFEKCKHLNKIKSDWHDGIFIQQALFYNIPINYVDKCYGFHNCGR